MTTLTDRLRSTCQELVRTHVPEEADLFEHIWSAFWHRLGCQGIEELRARPELLAPNGPVRVLGAVHVGGQELDTLLLMGPLVSALVQLQGTPPKAKLTLDVIGQLLQHEVSRMNVPPHIGRILCGHAPPMIADLLGVERPTAAMAQSSPAVQSLVWVEYCRTKAKRDEPPKVDRGHFDPAQVESRFRQKRDEFELFVDEFADGISLPAKKKFVPWSDLATRHKILLGLVLSAFYTRAPMRLKNIFEEAIEKGDPLAFEEPVNIRRLKMELLRRLHGVLDSVVVAERGMKRYVITGQIPYCWIRPGDKSSRLLLGSPAKA